MVALKSFTFLVTMLLLLATSIRTALIPDPARTNPISSSDYYDTPYYRLLPLVIPSLLPPRSNPPLHQKRKLKS